MLNVLLVIFKEVIELIMRRTKRFAIRSNDKKAAIQLQSKGYYILEKKLDKQDCEIGRSEIDKYINSGKEVWMDDIGSDKRIFNASKKIPYFNTIFNDRYINDILNYHTGSTSPDRMLLAARLDSGDTDNKGSGGGWHRDSPITHQYKVIIYLSDVSLENGPFEYVQESNSKIKIIESLTKKIFKPMQYRYEEHEVENYCNKTKSRIQEFTASQGTMILIDAKGIHRGRPIESGSRYALTFYIWTRMPKHFKEL